MTTEDQDLFIQTGELVDLAATVTHTQEPPVPQCAELIRLYDDLLETKRHSWTTHLRMIKELGRGGQGVVYLTQRRGADDFTLPVAIKVFSPERYPGPAEYDGDMLRMARVASRVARIQHENLLQVYNFLDRDRIRMMVMEWVEGYDLRRLMTPKMFGIVQERFSKKRWDYINDVLITVGEDQPRFRPGVAVAIVRECLEGLAAMHRQGIVHGDVKPANIMLKRSGHVKMIDMGSAFEVNNPMNRRTCTPTYASAEVLTGGDCTPLSDLASVGYVLLELIAGRNLFSDCKNLDELISAKENLWENLQERLPAEIADNDLLMGLCRGLTDPDPDARFQSAEAADHFEDGASAFHRQLIKADLATEYDQDIRVWIDELLEIEETMLMKDDF
ncbi:serine/threonine-protein kinase [Mariniblastus fucicola]|uniref:Serine/threonine-protein kinase PknL n=1 Tax=Mariniblastus fucicola TaxID=980251 RepID=A0A5B9PAB4_9BACT|nr:serine/threonine-protein kinase [Mariniblastus fucicola]QEG23204.1 Serine/threonine-protein kinase PknL [Mariniblastus fucicola]